MRDESGIVFSHVLENAGVFKSDEAGQAAFLRFLKAAGFTPGQKVRQFLFALQGPQFFCCGSFFLPRCDFYIPPAGYAVYNCGKAV